MVKDLSVRLCGVELRNPVIPASGTFGFGTELEGAFDLNLLGGISLKGTTEKARYGNPTPRIAECPSGMINSVGLQNPGIDVLVEEKVPGNAGVEFIGISLEELVQILSQIAQKQGAALAGQDALQDRFVLSQVVEHVAQLHLEVLQPGVAPRLLLLGQGVVEYMVEDVRTHGAQ